MLNTRYTENIDIVTFTWSTIILLTYMDIFVGKCSFLNQACWCSCVLQYFERFLLFCCNQLHIRKDRNNTRCYFASEGVASSFESGGFGLFFVFINLPTKFYTLMCQGFHRFWGQLVMSWPISAVHISDTNRRMVSLKQIIVMLLSPMFWSTMFSKISNSSFLSSMQINSRCE